MKMVMKNDATKRNFLTFLEFPRIVLQVKARTWQRISHDVTDDKSMWNWCVSWIVGELEFPKQICLEFFASTLLSFLKHHLNMLSNQKQLQDNDCGTGINISSVSLNNSMMMVSRQTNVSVWLPKKFENGSMLMVTILLLLTFTICLVCFTLAMITCGDHLERG